MCYSRRYNTQIPKINERLRELLKIKHLSGQVEHEFDRNLHVPTGWAILKVDSVDRLLNGELDSFISTLEKFNGPESVGRLRGGGKTPLMGASKKLFTVQQEAFQSRFNSQYLRLWFFGERAL